MDYTYTRLEIANTKSNIWLQKNITQSILQNLPEKTTWLSEVLDTKWNTQNINFGFIYTKDKKSREKIIICKTQSKYKQRVLMRGARILKQSKLNYFNVGVFYADHKKLFAIDEKMILS